MMCDGKNRTADSLLWDEPMCAVGWEYASIHRRNGTRGVQRHVDYGNVFAMLKQRAQDG